MNISRHEFLTMLGIGAVAAPVVLKRKLQEPLPGVSGNYVYSPPVGGATVSWSTSSIRWDVRKVKEPIFDMYETSDGTHWVRVVPGAR